MLVQCLLCFAGGRGDTPCVRPFSVGLFLLPRELHTLERMVHDFIMGDM